MKKTLTLMSLFALLFGCNIPDDGKNIPTSKLEALTNLNEINDSAKEVLKSKPNTKRIAKPLFIATGDNPGWYAAFSADHLRLLINDGSDSLNLNHDFSKILSERMYKETIVGAASDKDKSGFTLVIQIETKACGKPDRTKKERSVTLRYNNQTMKGCGGTIIE